MTSRADDGGGGCIDAAAFEVCDGRGCNGTGYGQSLHDKIMKMMAMMLAVLKVMQMLGCCCCSK